MINITKTIRATIWHIKDEIINETLCGRSLTKYWDIQQKVSVDSLPKSSMCKECMKNVQLSVTADTTHKHYTW